MCVCVCVCVSMCAQIYVCKCACACVYSGEFAIFSVSSNSLELSVCARACVS